jgi:hypothetical protein
VLVFKAAVAAAVSREHSRRSALERLSLAALDEVLDGRNAA